MIDCNIPLASSSYIQSAGCGVIPRGAVLYLDWCARLICSQGSTCVWFGLPDRTCGVHRLPDKVFIDRQSHKLRCMLRPSAITLLCSRALPASDALSVSTSTTSAQKQGRRAMQAPHKHCATAYTIAAENGKAALGRQHSAQPVLTKQFPAGQAAAPLTHLPPTKLTILSSAAQQV